MTYSRSDFRSRTRTASPRPSTACCWDSVSLIMAASFNPYLNKKLAASANRSIAFSRRRPARIVARLERLHERLRQVPAPFALHPAAHAVPGRIQGAARAHGPVAAHGVDLEFAGLCLRRERKQ